MQKSDVELGLELKKKFQSFESYPEPTYGTNKLGCSEGWSSPDSVLCICGFVFQLELELSSGFKAVLGALFRPPELSAGLLKQQMNSHRSWHSMSMTE